VCVGERMLPLGLPICAGPALFCCFWSRREGEGGTDNCPSAKESCRIALSSYPAALESSRGPEDGREQAFCHREGRRWYGPAAGVQCPVKRHGIPLKRTMPPNLPVEEIAAKGPEDSPVHGPQSGLSGRRQSLNSRRCFAVHRCMPTWFSAVLLLEDIACALLA